VELYLHCSIRIHSWLLSSKNLPLSCEISSSHGGEYEAEIILGCTAVFLIGCRPTFQRSVLPPSSGRWVSLATKQNKGSLVM
jgi:hypothetical protein